MGGKYLNKNGPAPKKRKWPIVLIVVVLVIAVLVGALFIGADLIFGFVAGKTTKAPETNPPTAPTAEATDATAGSEGSVQTDPSEGTTETEPTWPEVVATQNVTTIMLVGQNYREGEEHYLSDTMIMCTINRDTNTLTMTSLLRDLYVPIPAYHGHGPGRNRINVCYHMGTLWTGSVRGGMEMLALCVEQNFGIPIDHTVEVDFVAFEKVIDLLGGVDIDLTQAEADYLNSDACAYYGFDDFSAGPQTLTGLEALAYARIRAIDGDFQRTERQRNVINSLIQKCKSMGMWEVYKLANEILPMVTTDMTDDEIKNYIWEFIPMLVDLNIVSQKVPLEKDQMNGDWSYSGKEVEGIGNVLEPNLWSHKKYLQQILGYADVE